MLASSIRSNQLMENVSGAILVWNRLVSHGCMAAIIQSLSRHFQVSLDVWDAGEAPLERCARLTGYERLKFHNSPPANCESSGDTRSELKAKSL